MTRAGATFLIGAVCLVAAGCRPPQAEGDIDTSRPSEFGFQVSVQTSLEEEGQAAYTRYCTGCHGTEGDGRGEAARFFNPQPRNFQLANYKFSWTRSGSLPTDQDLERTIREGLKGSAMPPFELLANRTVKALVAYLKTFSPKWQQQAPSPRIPLVEDPFLKLEDKGEAIARGEAVYHGYATCWSCHPAYVPEDQINAYIVALGGRARPGFRPGLERSVGKENAEGWLIYPPDFRRDYVRSGAELEDIYRVIGAGITGTAMPTWVDSMTVHGKAADAAPLVQTADLWAMAYYVQDLMRQRPKKLQPGEFVLRDRPRTIYAPGELPEPKVPGEEEDEEEDWDDWGEDEEDEDEDAETEDAE